MRRRLSKSAVKTRGPTTDVPSILGSLSLDEVCGMSGVAVKCLDITQNTDCEGSVPILD